MERLEDLRLFTLVAEGRSFTRAADRLGLSKSAASRRIGELETRLGARLFNRTTRHISLTQVGEGFYQRVSQILEALEEAERSVASQHAAPRGRLKLAAPMSFGIQHLSSAVAEFMERYPEVEVEMELSDRFVDLVDEGFDLAVRIGRLKDSSLVARRLCPVRAVLCASPGYLARRGTPQVPADLLQHDCLIYTNSSTPEQWSFRTEPGAEETRSIRVNGRLYANNGDALREAAVTGQGLVLLPTFIVGEALSRGRLVPVLDDYLLSQSAVHAVYPANRHLSPKVRAFVDFLASRFGPVPYWDAGLTLLKGG
ncbi:LysR family transcriptional regulator [Niveispirillum sp. BGYR6]|uniref:LysR family transcriptional regulator n=1 Tax=Niveispirillum sp. BGYR6 TaxID=2971249 RepID=UPI0022B94BC8|nr:LysR family transcriptional regulator [Niveispirillum sp. BGYR6]MDG5494789.1 LysR family transcriptional regulator [Niveispirillum sp. BGYR6]